MWKYIRVYNVKEQTLNYIFILTIYKTETK